MKILSFRTVSGFTLRRPDLHLTNVLVINSDFDDIKEISHRGWEDFLPRQRYGSRSAYSITVSKRNLQEPFTADRSTYGQGLMIHAATLEILQRRKSISFLVPETF